jgi:hypothetical protein
VPRGMIEAKPDSDLITSCSHFKLLRQFSKLFSPHTMSEEDQANGENMRVDPQRAQALAENVGSVLQKISGAAGGRQVRHA